VTEALSAYGRASLSAGLGFVSRVSPYYWLPTLLLAFAVQAIATVKVPEGVCRALFPGGLKARRSHTVDAVLMLLGFLVQASGVVSFVGIAATSAVLVIDALERAGLRPAPVRGAAVSVMVTVITAVTADFCTYWVHRLHHRFAALWPFHELHHSAEVMSPVTFYRKHPVYDALHNAFTALFSGALQGLLVATLVGKPSAMLIGDANALYVFFNLTGSNLRHSHFWLSYGPRLDRWLVSPAMHQIHHSRAPRHRDKNFGEVFAFWDRMFGTLYVPTGREALDFGLSDEHGNALPDPHDSVRSALLLPFKHSARAIAGSLGLSRRAP
jgi:sterol desaturase/sphingolipid hydroxylase (fatty acid hydroxylase superfamily)